MRNLILSGGIRHDFDDNASALKAQLTSAGFQSEIETNIEAGLSRLNTSKYNLLTVIALRWRMKDNPKYKPYRNEWAFSLSPEGRENLRRFVHGGGGLFGLHTACICFDDWPEWKAILGGVWSWGHSSHPPLGPVSVTPTAEKHPLTEDLEPFEIIDEVFSDLSISSSVRPLLVARTDGLIESKPVLWIHEYGSGRVVFNALGHNRSSIEHNSHSRIIRDAATWAAR